MQRYPWEFAQIQLNYVDWDFQDAKAQYEILERHGLPAIIMEPVRGGALADLGEGPNQVLKRADQKASIASWAIATRLSAQCADRAQRYVY